MSSPDTVKQCCARLYESDFAKLLLGDSFHPGGTRLTERLGELLGLGPQSRVLDIASDTGTSALFLAERVSCEVGCRVERVEPHDEALLEMVNEVRTKLLGTEILVGLKKLELPGVDFTAAKEMARPAASAVQQGSLGYAILHASKP
jgi:hypothetical protein